jgi:hypothetical protein
VTNNESWRRFLDAGTAVGQATLTKATEIAKGLMDPEHGTRERAWRDLDDLGRAGRQLGEQLAGLAKSRLASQRGHFGSLEETLDWVADLVATRQGRHEPPSRASDLTDWLTGGEAPRKANGTGSNGKRAKKSKKKEKAAAADHQKKKATGSGDKKHKKRDRARGGSDPDRVLRLTRVGDPADRR